MRMIQELKADIQELKADAEKQQRNTSAMVQELRVDMSKVRQQRVPAQQLAADKVKEYFNITDTFFNDWVRPVLLNPTAFWVAIVLDLQWHLRFHFAQFFHKTINFIYALVWSGPGWSKSQVKPMMFPRRLGLNVLILNIYFDETVDGMWSWVKGRPLVTSVSLILVDTIVVFYLFGLIGSLFGQPETAAEYQDPFSEGDEDDGLCPDKVEATNIYEDFTLKFQRVLPLWIAQMSLVALYVEELNKDKAVTDFYNFKFVYWGIAVLFQMYGGDAQVGEPFNHNYWTRALNSHHVEEVKTKLGKLGECLCKADTKTKIIKSKADTKTDIINSIKDIKKNKGSYSDLKMYRGGPYSDLKMRQDVGTDLEAMRRWSFGSVHHHCHEVFSVVSVPLSAKFWFEWRVRWIMDLAVNSVARNIVLYTVPLLVCIEKPLDVVKDLTAVMFITMLDDCGTPKAIEEMLVKLKFNIAHSGKTAPSPPCCCPCGQGKGVELDPLEKWYVSENRDRFERLAALEGWQDFVKMEELEEGYSPPSPV